MEKKFYVNEYGTKDLFTLIKSVFQKKVLFCIGIILSILSSSSSLLIPQLTKNVIDTSEFSTFKTFTIFLLGLMFLAQLFFSAISNYILRYVGEYTVKELRDKIWNHLLYLPISFFDNHKSTKTVSHLVNDTTVIKEVVSEQLPNFISGVIQLTGSLIILFIMDWKMASIMFLSVPVFALIMKPIGMTMVKLGNQLQLSIAEFNTEASEKLSEIRLVKSSNTEKYESDSGKDFISKIFTISMQDAKIEAILQPIMMTLILAMFSGILGYGAIRVQSGDMTTGTLVAFLLYLFNITAPIASFLGFFNHVKKSIGATKHLDFILRQSTEILNKGIGIDDNFSIVGENIDFSYTSSSSVLKNINFEAYPGQIIAFAGPSGSGKTTLFSLIEGFYTPSYGNIYIGNHSLKELRIDKVRRHIGYVSQDSPVFSGSIRSNLNYGLNYELSDNEIWQGLQLAHADSFVRNLKDGLNTTLGERGTKLSGGQKQRIAIARAFIRNPDILMLDEATANLDGQSEEKIQQAIKSLMKDRTTIIIAHRLSTIVKADKIFFLENGEITGSGTHQELIKNHSLYAKYVKEQLI